MTVGQIKTLVVSWLDDANKTYMTDSQLLTWINAAQRQVQLKLLQSGQNWYMKPVETTLVVGQSDYLLPSDFIESHRIEIITSGTGTNEIRKQLTKMTTNQQDFVAISSGEPSNYYIKKDRIAISPTPDQALTMRLYYSPMVQDLSGDSDTPDVPEEFMELVALNAAFNGFIKDDRAPQNLVMRKMEIEKLFEQMAVDRTTESSRQVVQTMDYDPVMLW